MKHAHIDTKFTDTDAELSSSDLSVASGRLQAARRRDMIRAVITNGNGCDLCEIKTDICARDIRALWSAVRTLCRRKANPPGILALKQNLAASAETHLELQINRMELARLLDLKRKLSDQKDAVMVLKNAVFGQDCSLKTAD